MLIIIFDNKSYEFVEISLFNGWVVKCEIGIINGNYHCYVFFYLKRKEKHFRCSNDIFELEEGSFFR